MPKAVLDSTILVSAFLTKAGISRQLLELAEAGMFRICLADEILEETERVLLEYPRIRKRYSYTDEAVQEYIGLLRVVAEVVTGLPAIQVVDRDPNDDMVIACGVKAKADYIVTRDKDMLTLAKHGELSIVSPEEFIRLLQE